MTTPETVTMPKLQSAPKSVTFDERRAQTSASNAEADSLCPARFLRQQGQPDERSKYSESGDKVHLALSKFVPGKPEANQAEVAALSLEERDVYDRCLQIEGKLLGQFFPPDQGQVKIFREASDKGRYWVRFKNNGTEFSHSGKPDVVYRQGARALVVEYKTGRNEVKASPRNLQLRDQVLLVRGNFIPTTEAGAVVIQPYVTMTPTVAVYKAPDMDRAFKEMCERIIGSHDPNAKAVAGEVQCQYCLAKKVCKEYQQWAGQITPPAMLTVLEVPMASWTPEQCATAAAALSPAEKFLDQLKAFLKGKLEADPNSVPGWFLAPGSVREKIINPQAVLDRFIQLGGKLEQFMPSVSVGKGELKKALSAVTGARGKALDQAMDTITKDCVEATQAAGSLKRKDPEPEVAP